jgi:3-(3-hydroxy-phenyl)propionate hydroxylase
MARIVAGSAETKDQTDYDVAVVGFGPSGAVATGLLGAQGLRTFACDKQLHVYDKPRAIALDHEILRLFQQMGLHDLIAPYIEPFTDSVYYGVDGQVIKRMSTLPPPYPLGHLPSVVFSQPAVEQVLRQHAMGLAGVTVALGQTLIDVQQGAQQAHLTLQDEQGHLRRIGARYVIACDGASSTVRSLTGLALEDLAFDEPWLVIDALVHDSGLAKLPQTSAQYCQPGRPSTYLIGPGRHRRWEISLLPGEDPQALATEEGAWGLLAPWLQRGDATLWRQSSYRFHALVAQQWRKGRVFLAGDAAHQQPPFLGQGMCQGLRDVANLTWKLGAVLKAGAPDRLLDTYGCERKGHVIDLTNRIKQIGAIICERDAQRAHERDTRLLAECGGLVRPTPRQDVQPALCAGLLAQQTHPARGTLFPQPWLRGAPAQTQRMDDAMGPGWWLVLAPRVHADVRRLAERLSAFGLRVTQTGTPQCQETEGLLNDWFRRHGCQAAWVRPDRYVYGVAHHAGELREQWQALSHF